MIEEQIIFDSELFNTEEKRTKATNDLAGLIHHPGWILLMQMFDNDVKSLERQILDNEELNPQDEKELKISRNDLLTFMSTPIDTIKKLRSDPEKFDSENDPYYTSEEIDKMNQVQMKPVEEKKEDNTQA